MEKIKDKIYLVKIPESVFNQIIKNKEPGIVDIYENNSNTNNKDNLDINFKVKLNGTNDSAALFNISLQKTDNLFGFKDKKNKIKKIEYRGSLTGDSEYVSDLITRKVAKEEDDNKASIAIELKSGRPKAEGIIPISNHQFKYTEDNWASAVSAQNRKKFNLKKVRKDKEELHDEIFNLFSFKKYWTNKELVAKLDQPENYLKDVLSEVCSYIRSGPKKGCYELKEQYINVVDEGAQ